MGKALIKKNGRYFSILCLLAGSKKLEPQLKAVATAMHAKQGVETVVAAILKETCIRIQEITLIRHEAAGLTYNSTFLAKTTP